MKKDWYDNTISKEQEIQGLRQQLSETLKELDKRSRPGSSNDAPGPVDAATHTVNKIKTETIKEDKDHKPPDRPGGHGGGGDGGGSGDPSDPGRASHHPPGKNNNNKPPP